MHQRSSIEVAGEALAEAAAQPLADRPGGVPSALVRSVAAVAERAEAELVRTVAWWDADHVWADDGARGPIPWLRHQTGMAESAARRVVRCARMVRRYERVAKLLAHGDITVDHVDALSWAARGARLWLFEEHLDALLDQAMALAAPAFTVVAHRWANLADDVLESAPAEGVAGNELHLSGTVGRRYRLDGWLDGEDGALVEQALARLDRPDPVDLPGGTRSSARRRADALVELARRFLAGEPGFDGDESGRPAGPGVGAGDGAGVAEAGAPEVRRARTRRPAHTVNVLVDLRVLEGTHPDLVEASVVPSCDVVGVGPVAPAVVRRLLCDSWVSGIVVGVDGEVLHLGRRARLFSDAQRRAIELRDGGCAWPGCTAPLHWCEVHHVRPFAAGGATDVANGVLLCGHHHRLAHEQGWQLVRGPDGAWDARPPERRGRRRGGGPPRWPRSPEERGLSGPGRSSDHPPGAGPAPGRSTPTAVPP